MREEGQNVAGSKVGEVTSQGVLQWWQRDVGGRKLIPIKSAKKTLNKIEEKQKQVGTRNSENRTFPGKKEQAKKIFFRTTNCSSLD